MTKIKEIIEKKQQIIKSNFEKIIDIGNKDSAGSDDDVQSEDNHIPEFYIKERLQQKLKNKTKTKSRFEKNFVKNYKQKF